MNEPSADALAVLALCEASADSRAAERVRMIIDDAGLPVAVKAGFFSELRPALEDPAHRDMTPYEVMLRFMDGPGAKYMARGEEVPGLSISTASPQEYVRTLLALALREEASHVQVIPDGTAIYRGATLRLVAASPGDLFPEVFEYCRRIVDIPERETAHPCAVAADGSLLPSREAGRPARLQIVTNGRTYGVQIVFTPR